MLVRGKYILTSTDPDDIYDGSLKVAEGINSEIVKWDSLVAEYDEEYKKARAKYTIPGFRKGKVPEQIVKKNIEDNKGNVTRFLIMGSKASHPEFKKKNYITSCIFKVKNKPAALYKCLGGFATNNVNLSKLESFSDQNSFEQYLFICDIYGHIEDPKIQKSLEELGFHTVSLDILGVYEASEYRKI